MLKHFFSLGNKIEDQKIGVNTHVISQINSLEVERDILTKTISRLYENDNDSDLNKIQRDRLLLRYQHQLGVIIAKIQKLESVSKHPDLGPLGEGLITLMDQKLSQLDQRLYELTAKIQIGEDQKQGTIKQKPVTPKSSMKNQTLESSEVKPAFEKPLTSFVEEPKRIPTNKFEITTLTPHSKMDSVKQTKYDQMLSQLDSDVITPPKKITKPEINHIENKPEAPKPIIVEEPKPIITEQPKQEVQLPAEPEIDDDDDDDLDKIRTNIMKTLSKIEQAEVD